MAPIPCEFGMDSTDLKQQRASRRAASLSKNRAEYKKRSAESDLTGRKVSAAPVGSDFATPHRAARTATRTCLSNGTVNSGSDMPQISMGREGTWKRWIRKPSFPANLGHLEVGQDQATDGLVQQFLATEGKSLWHDEEFQKSLLMMEEEGRAILEQARLAALANAEAYQIEESDVDMHTDVSRYGGASPLPESTDESSYQFDLELGSEAAFSSLTPKAATLAQQELTNPETLSAAEPETLATHDELAPTSEPSKASPTMSHVQEVPPKDDMNAELEEWIVVSADNSSKHAGAPCMQTVKLFDEQHPRNLFAKRPRARSKNAKSEKSQDAGFDMDWCQEGIPTELKRQFIHASINSAHLGLHNKKQTSSPSLDILRAESIRRSKRQNSVPKTPRARSKPRVVHQPTNRR